MKCMYFLSFFFRKSRDWHFMWLKSVICTQRKIRSAGCSGSSLPTWRRFRSLATHRMPCEEVVSYCVYAQADLSLRWAHMPVVYIYNWPQYWNKIMKTFSQISQWASGCLGNYLGFWWSILNTADKIQDRSRGRGGGGGGGGRGWGGVTVVRGVGGGALQLIKVKAFDTDASFLDLYFI